MEKEIDTQELGEKIVRVLKTIYDPEIPVDIYELGLIYDVMVNTDYEVKILMTLTTPNCGPNRKPFIDAAIKLSDYIFPKPRISDHWRMISKKLFWPKIVAR